MSESTKPPMAFDPNPPKYTTPLPSIPRSPRVPGDFGQLMSPTVAARDTVRTEAPSGEHAVSYDPEKTPIESPNTLKQLGQKMDAALAASERAAQSSENARLAARDAANNSLTMMMRLDEFAAELKRLAQRVTSLEVSRQWAPLVVAAVALGISLWFGFRTQELQRQVLDLQHQVMTLEQR